MAGVIVDCGRDRLCVYGVPVFDEDVGMWFLKSGLISQKLRPYSNDCDKALSDLGAWRAGRSELRDWRVYSDQL